MKAITTKRSFGRGSLGAFLLAVAIWPAQAACTVGCLEGKPVAVCEDTKLPTSECMPRTVHGEARAYCGTARFKAFPACPAGGMIGLQGVDVDKDMAGALGLPQATGGIIAEVDKGTPAEKAGLKVGDVILAVNDTETADFISLSVAVRKLSPGATATLTVWRNHTQQQLAVKVGSPPVAPAVKCIDKSIAAMPADSPLRQFFAGMPVCP